MPFVLLSLLALLFSNPSVAATPLTLDVGDNVTLDARYYAAKEPGPGLIFLNMCDPSRDQAAWATVATTLSQQGYHVLTFDYRGFGNSGGERPTHLRSVEEAMPYWRDNWVPDVQAAYDLLISQEGVKADRIGVAGASCGVFLGLEFSLNHPNVKSLVILGGPTDAVQRDRLIDVSELPILLISGDERGPNEEKGTLEWSDEIFAASADPGSLQVKFKSVTHGTNIFERHPETQQMVVDWFVETISVE